MKDGSPATSSPTLNAVNHDSTNAVFRSDYTIKSVSKSDSGIYVCTVTNPIGSDSQTFKVIAVDGKLSYSTVSLFNLLILIIMAHVSIFFSG